MELISRLTNDHLSNSESTNQDKEKDLNLQLRKEVMKHLVTYFEHLRKLGVVHTGYREFYSDGTSMAFCSSAGWYNINLDIEMRAHYLQELMNIKKTGYCYVIRSAHNIHNKFLRELKNQDMCNSLIIYKKDKNLIKQYSFIATLVDSNIINAFINKLPDFEMLASLYGQKLREIFAKKIYHSVRTPLLPREAVGDILSNNFDKLKLEGTGVIKNPKIELLTWREKECMACLLMGATNKEMALRLGISIKTVEYHLQRVREKLHVCSRFELIKMYKHCDRQAAAI